MSCFANRRISEKVREKSNWLVTLVFCVISPIFSFGAIGAVGELQITDITNPKIVELYNQLQEKRGQITSLESERHNALEENYQAMHENEQRFENRALGATTSAATGLGGMQLAEGIAEQNADRAAEEDMQAYIATIKCEYGKGQQVEMGTQDVTLPGGNELLNLYTEYKQIAERLKETKAALGLRPGIESEILYDKAQTGLYQYASTGKTGGGYTSLYNALTDETSDDAAAWAEQKQESTQKRQAGLAAAGAGVIAGIAGNIALNKDAPKESSDKINREYDDKVATAKQEIESIETDLDNVIAENKKQVDEYNTAIAELRGKANKIKTGACKTLFAEFIDDVKDLEQVEHETDVVPDVTLPKIDDNLIDKCDECTTQGAELDITTGKCECPNGKTEIKGECVEKPAEVITPEVEKEVATQEISVTETEVVAEQETDPNQCPATGNRLPSLSDKDRVGDFCSSSNIAAGEVVWWSGSTKDNKICTCRAYACNNGFHSEKGACKKNVEEEPDCPMQNYTNVPQNELANGPMAFCERKKTGKCKITSVSVINGNVMCNIGDFCQTQEYELNEENNTIQNCQTFCKKQTQKKCLFIQGRHDTAF